MEKQWGPAQGEKNEKNKQEEILLEEEIELTDGANPGSS